jgi:hypothetical protein
MKCTEPCARTLRHLAAHGRCQGECFVSLRCHAYSSAGDLGKRARTGVPQQGAAHRSFATRLAVRSTHFLAPYFTA